MLLYFWAVMNLKWIFIMWNWNSSLWRLWSTNFVQQWLNCKYDGQEGSLVPLSRAVCPSLLCVSSSPDTSLQLRRDVIFCQAATGALCTLAEQVLAALRSRFNNAGEYQEDGMETSRKWLEQISAIGTLMHFQSTLSPHMVRFLMARGKTRPTLDFSSVMMEAHTWKRVPHSLPAFKTLLLLWLLPSEGRADHVRRHQGGAFRFGQSHCVLQAAGRRVSCCK